jgi:hypothetical protein
MYMLSIPPFFTSEATLQSVAVEIEKITISVSVHIARKST